MLQIHKVSWALRVESSYVKSVLKENADRIKNFTLSLIDDSQAVLKVGRPNVI